MRGGPQTEQPIDPSDIISSSSMSTAASPAPDERIATAADERIATAVDQRIAVEVDVECCTAPRPTATLKGTRAKYEQALARLEASLRGSLQGRARLTVRVNSAVVDGGHARMHRPAPALPAHLLVLERVRREGRAAWGYNASDVGEGGAASRRHCRR